MEEDCDKKDGLIPPAGSLQTSCIVEDPDPVEEEDPLFSLLRRREKQRKIDGDDNEGA